MISFPCSEWSCLHISPCLDSTLSEAFAQALDMHFAVLVPGGSASHIHAFSIPQAPASCATDSSFFCVADDEPHDADFCSMAGAFPCCSVCAQSISNPSIWNRSPRLALQSPQKIQVQFHTGYVDTGQINCESWRQHTHLQRLRPQMVEPSSWSTTPECCCPRRKFQLWVGSKASGLLLRFSFCPAAASLESRRQDHSDQQCSR